MHTDVQKRGSALTEKGGEVGMRTPHKCITCKHYKPYHCTLNDAYIGYLDCDELTKCRAWRKSAAYKKGGKFYEEIRKEGEMG